LKIISKVLQHGFISELYPVNHAVQKYIMIVEIDDQQKERILSDKSFKILEIRKL
jgi:hypothetical protein